MIPALLLVLITILCMFAKRFQMYAKANLSTVPPVGVFMIAGCGADLLINVCLTLLGFVFVN